MRDPEIIVIGSDIGDLLCRIASESRKNVLILDAHKKHGAAAHVKKIKMVIRLNLVLHYGVE